MVWVLAIIALTSYQKEAPPFEESVQDYQPKFLQRHLQTVDTFDILNVKVSSTHIKDLSNVDFTLKPKTYASSSNAYIIITFPSTVTLTSQLGCSVIPLSTLNMQSAAYCAIYGNQVQIQQPFYSIGYYPVQDGTLIFTLKNIIINGETNSAFGTFRVEINDNNAPRVVGDFINNQTIMPLTMIYSSTQIIDLNKQSVSMRAGDENMTYVLNFTTAYQTPQYSQFTLNLPLDSVSILD